MNPAHIFREYDIRGLHETELTDAGVADVGRAFGTMVRRAGRHDASRSAATSARSSPRLADGARGRLTAQPGCDVLASASLPTPGLYYVDRAPVERDAGVQVTGSHNPTEYNGFKMNEALASDLRRARSRCCGG